MADENKHPGFVAPNAAAGPSRLRENAASDRGGRDGNEDLSDSELMDQLEQDLEDEDSGFNMGAFRERRMEQLREE